MKRAIAFSFLLACSGLLLGDSPDSRSPSRESPSLLQDLVAMTNAGMSDLEILAYAKAHRAELPAEVSRENLLRLRRSGVSEAVVAYMTAIDVRASDSGAGDVSDDSDEARVYSNRYNGRYSNSYSESYPDSYGNGYPESDYGGSPESYYNSYPEAYYNDYYPFYGPEYYPYPFYFFANRGGSFWRFRGRGDRFAGRGERFFDRGGFGRGRSPRGGFDRDRWRDRGSRVVGPRGTGRPGFPRGSVGQGFGGPRGAVLRPGGPGRPTFPRGGFSRGPSASRGSVVRNGGSGRPSFAGGGRSGGGFGRSPAAPSGGSRGSSGRPAGHGRR